MLIDISKISNIETIINAERIILRYESGTFGNNNPQANKSISEAIKELDSAYKTYLIVLDKDKYQIANDTHSIKDKDRKNGLPKDAFHKFINSHKTRPGNRIRTFELSSEERQLLNQRQINMKIALNEYMKLQAISLNIAPDK